MVKTLLCLHLAPVDIHQIGHHREGVEGHAHGQGAGGLPQKHAPIIQDSHHLPGDGQDDAALPVAQEEVQIFEHDQYRDVDGHGDDQRPALASTDLPGQAEIQPGQAHQQSQVQWLAHGVEDQAGA